jgi:hypothetical protein
MVPKTDKPAPISVYILISAVHTCTRNPFAPGQQDLPYRQPHSLRVGLQFLNARRRRHGCRIIFLILIVAYLCNSLPYFLTSPINRSLFVFR